MQHFYHKLGTGYFINKQVFEKKQYFSENMIILKGRRQLATKTDINFFIGNEVLNIFHLTIFLKKKKIQINRGKIIFGAHDHF